MGKSKKCDTDKKQLQIRFEANAVEAIGQMQEMTGLSPTEVVRWSLAFFQFLLNELEKDDDCELLIRGKGGEIKGILLPFSSFKKTSITIQ